MTYPTPGEYQEALQFPESALADPHLQEAEPEKNVLGLPRAITGAFAVVFPVATRGARWALKCFLTDVPDQRRRYRAIGEHLAREHLPNVADFEYQEEGVRVNGRAYPLLKMQWLEGIGLNRYVAERVAGGDLAAIRELIPRWRALMAVLEASEIAHGDLQHGNILVDGGRLRLVDYDTMYVPALAGRKSPEVGHRNYQHPDRDERDFGAYVDRFSALVIDTALQACAHRPALWERYDTGENLLFRSEDFAEPASSVLFDELRRIEPLRAQIDALQRACFLEPELVPPLEDVVADTASVPEVSDRAVRRRRAGEHRDAHGPDSVHRAALGHHAGLERGDFERWALPVVVGISGATIATGFIIGWMIAGIAATALLTPGAFVVGLRYRRIPAVRRRHRLEREDAYFLRLIAGLRDDLDRAKRRRQEILSSQEERAAARLREIQLESLNERLKHHFVGEIRGFEGLTHKVVVRLKAEGIRTASHATRERVNAIRQLSPESKARVNLWRASLAEGYRGDVPTSLSPAEERRLKRRLETQLEEIDREIVRLQQKIAFQEKEHAAIRARLAELDAPTPAEYVLFLLRVRN